MKDPISRRLSTIADNIRRARLQRNYSQDYLAFKMGFSQNAYSKIELGYTTLTLINLFRIAEILEVDAMELLGVEVALAY